jgi:hypothetical protein
MSPTPGHPFQTQLNDLTELFRRQKSALGHKRTFCAAEAMSALLPKADIRGAKTNVRFVLFTLLDGAASITAKMALDEVNEHRFQ